MAREEWELSRRKVVMKGAWMGAMRKRMIWNDIPDEFHDVVLKALSRECGRL